LIIQMRDIEQYEFTKLQNIEMKWKDSGGASRARKTIRDYMTKTHYHGIS
jgi:RNA polymerase sigma-70 factor (ECF subfamily)